MSADPYRASGYKVDPRSWNRYAYVRNNTVNRVDPAGLQDGDPPPPPPDTTPKPSYNDFMGRGDDIEIEDNPRTRTKGDGLAAPAAVIFQDVTWEDQTVQFDGLGFATVDLSGNACAGGRIDIKVRFIFEPDDGDFDDNFSKVKVSKDNQFEVERYQFTDGSPDGGDVAIQLRRVNRRASRSTVVITVAYGSGVSPKTNYGTATVLLRCP